MKYFKKYSTDELAERKYNHLLIGMILLLLVGPLYLRTGLKFPLMTFIFFTIVQLALQATIDNKRRLWLYRLIMLVALVCALSSQHVTAPLNDVLYAVGRSIHIVFLIMTIRLFMGRIIVAGQITADKVKGGICLYFLAGVAWGFLYEVIHRFDPTAFQIEKAAPLMFLYYSYSTLTTLGIGDIIPTNDLAVSLTCLEAIGGQMFVAVFIARLIGLHIIHKHNRVDTEKENK
jgi:hypothetical protein